MNQSPECREAFFCYDRFQPDGGLRKVCPEGEVIEIEIRYFTWGCVPDVGQCNGNFGGYSFGCVNGTLPEVPEEPCGEYTDNTLGTCECNGQGRKKTRDHFRRLQMETRVGSIKSIIGH